MAPASTFVHNARNSFVGRSRELAELRAGLDDVSAGHGRLFLLSGEADVGKTRLAEEISNDAAARGMQVVWGWCWERSGAPAYWPITQMLRACIDACQGEYLKSPLGPNPIEITRLASNCVHPNSHRVKISSSSPSL